MVQSYCLVFSQFVGHWAAAGDLCTVGWLSANYLDWDCIIISTSKRDDWIAE